MNLLLLVDWDYPCDHQFLTNVFSRSLVNRGHDVTWVMRPKNSELREVKQETWNGSKVYILPSSAFAPVKNYLRYKTGNIRQNSLFSSELDFGNFDIVHVRNDLSMGLAAITIQQDYELKFAHQISHLKAESLIEEYNQDISGAGEYIKGHLGRRLRGSIASKADIILPISEAMKTYLRESGYETNMEVLPTGAPIVNEIPEYNSIDEEYSLHDKNVLLYIGSMSPIRKLEFLFDVLEELNCSKNIELVMAGGRIRENRERLHGIALQKGVATNVTFTGWIENQEKVHKMIARSDVGLSPLPTDSILRTNAPIKTLEYMSLGTPVVCSSTQDQEIVVSESGAGFAVDYEVKEFADAITKLLSSPELNSTMGARGREYIQKKRNFQTLTDRVENIYRTLIGDNPRTNV